MTWEVFDKVGKLNNDKKNYYILLCILYVLKLVLIIEHALSCWMRYL